MTESKEIDYKIAFEELSTLNRVVLNHTGSTLPALNPSHFELVTTDKSFSDVVVRSKFTGLHYLTTRSLVFSDATSNRYSYTAFLPAKPSERTVTDWKIS